MPTFETPIEPIKHSEFVAQIPLDALFKGLGYKQQEYDTTYQQLQSQIDAKAQTQAFGQDQAVAQQITDAMNSQLGQFNGALLTDPTVKSRINHLTSTTGKALLPIALRSAQYQKMLNEKQEAEAKGKKYFNEGLDQAEEYYQTGKYDPTVKFTSNAGIAPDVGKAMEEAKKYVGASQRQVQAPDGTYHLEEYYDPVKLRIALEKVLGADPNTDKYIQYQWNRSNKGTDWTSKPNDIIALSKAGIVEESDNYALAAKRGDQQAMDAALRRINQYKESAERYNKLMQNPHFEEQAKAQSLADARAAYFNDAAEAGLSVKDQEQKLKETTKLYLESKYKKEEERQRVIDEHLADAGLMEDPNNPGTYIPGKASYLTSGVGQRAGSKPVNQIDFNEIEDVIANIAKDPSKYADHQITEGGKKRYVLRQTPGIFNSTVFDRGTETVYHRDNPENPEEVTSTDKVHKYPTSVDYDPTLQKFRVNYKGNPPEFYTLEAIKSMIGIDKPSLVKNLGQPGQQQNQTGPTGSKAPSTQAELDAAYAALKPGESVTDVNGNVYTKPKPK